MRRVFDAPRPGAVDARLGEGLVFVVGIPLLAGVGITVAALRKGADEAPTREPASAGGADADSPEAP